MRKYISFCLLVLPLLLLAKDKEIQLKTQKVTVFLEGAQISATAKVSLVEGTNELIFSGLSPNIRQNSIQVKGLNLVSVNSIQFGITYLKKKTISAEVALLKDKIEDFKEKIALKQSAIDGLETEESLLMQNKTIASKESNSSLAKLKEYANYYRQRSEAIYNALYKLKKEQTEFQEEISDLELEIQDLDSKNETSRGEIKLLLNSEINQNSTLEISYIVEDAGWYPNYEIRAKDVNSPINFLYQANVFQNTGDDWEDVELSLSTADPSVVNQKPDLNPYYLNIPSPIFKMEDDNLDEVVVTGYAIRRKSSLNSAQEEVKEELVQKSEQLTAMNFKLPKKYSITSGEEPLKVKLDQQDLAADYEYYTAPVLDNKVYLTAMLKDWQSLDLLPGEARIYFEDTFTGQVFVDANLNTEDFEVALGNDQNIVVERKQINKLKSKSFFRNNVIVEKEYEISIKNNKGENVVVILEDRIPLSQNSDIKLDDQEFDDAKIDEETGILTWDVQLDAKTKKSKKFSYKVTYPKGKQVNIER